MEGTTEAETTKPVEKSIEIPKVEEASEEKEKIAEETPVGVAEPSAVTKQVKKEPEEKIAAKEKEEEKESNSEDNELEDLPPKRSSFFWNPFRKTTKSKKTVSGGSKQSSKKKIEKEEEEEVEESSDDESVELEKIVIPDDFEDQHPIPEEEEGYDLLKDPAFEDLESGTVFGDEEEDEYDALLEERQELYDVLHKSKEINYMSQYLERKFARRGLIPEAPTGGWVWRPAKVVKETEVEGPKETKVLWEFEFADEKGGKLTRNVAKFRDCVAPYKSKIDLEKHHNFEVGQLVDILDKYVSPSSGQPRMKWRSAKVIKVSDYFIRVNFVGWKNVWDTWLHVIKDKNRIAPHEKMTKRYARRAKRQMNNFQKVMNRKRNFKCVVMEGDGNCLFRCVAHQVYGTPEKHKKVRAECCSYMEKNIERFAMFSTENVYKRLRNMKKNGVWGEDCEIRVMEELYDRPFELYTVNAAGQGLDYKPTRIHFGGDLPENSHYLQPIRVSYHGNCHYNSIVPLDLKMNKKKAFKVEPLNGTNFIKSHREKMIAKSNKEERKRLRAQKRRAAEEKRKKQMEDAEEKVEEDNLSTASSEVVVISGAAEKESEVKSTSAAEAEKAVEKTSVPEVEASVEVAKPEGEAEGPPPKKEVTAETTRHPDISL